MNDALRYAIRLREPLEADFLFKDGAINCNDSGTLHLVHANSDAQLTPLENTPK